MFEQFGLDPQLSKALEKLGLEKPTPVQEAMIPAILADHDVQASASTGSGKSAAFLLPVLQKMLDKPAPNTATRCLVLSPTRELAIQLDSHCGDLASFTSVQSMTILGGENFKEQKAKLRKNPEIVIGTPGRLLEHVQKKSLDLSDLEFLILDEADRILDMGFRDDVMEIVSNCQEQRQTVMMSATLNHQGIGKISREVQKNPIQVAIGTHRSAHESIEQEIILADDLPHKRQLCNWLLANEDFKKAVVFTNTRAHSEELAVFLIKQGQRTACLHGEMQQDERKQVMQLFRDGKVNVLVATDLAARGLDIAEVDLVINFAMARSGDEYVHRIGRTGRAGASGRAITLIGPREWNLMESIERYLNLSFTRRTVEELPARFTGTIRKKKHTKKQKDRKTGPSQDKARSKAKQRHRNRKNIGKRRSVLAGTSTAEKSTVESERTSEKKENSKPAPQKEKTQSGKKTSGSNDGFAPLKRK